MRSPRSFALPSAGIPGCHLCRVVSIVGVYIQESATHCEEVCAQHEDKQYQPIILSLETVPSNEASSNLHCSGALQQVQVQQRRDVGRVRPDRRSVKRQPQSYRRGATGEATNNEQRTAIEA